MTVNAYVLIQTEVGRAENVASSARAIKGVVAADNVAAALGNGKLRKFRYKTLGVFVDMGRQKAVAQTLFLRWRGFPAWWLARTYHLWMMPGVKRKWRLLAGWTVDLLFSRDASVFRVAFGST